MDPQESENPEEALVAHIASSLGLSAAVARRVVDDVIAYHAETPEQYVARRHRELVARGLKNADIYRQLSQEVAARPFAGPVCSVRQIRRMIYG
jgi:hypothetical protein